MTEAVEILIKADDKASQKFATVAANAEKAGEKSSQAFREMGGRAKATTEFIGTLANLAGGSQFGAVAGQIAQLTERVSAFSEVSKAGGVGALGFKLGLVGLAATVGGVLGKALGDVILQTAKFERELKKTTEPAKELDSQIKQLQSTTVGNQREDIQLIRDPEGKRAAYKQLLANLNRDIEITTEVTKKSRREAEAWADAWQITPGRRRLGEQAAEQLAIDEERLKTLQEQRNEIIKIVGARAQEHEQIRAVQAAEDAQVEAMKKANEARLKAMEDFRKAQEAARKEAQREQEKAAETAQREVQRVEDLIASEQERLALQRVELEQGKEVARVHELVGQGVDETTAKQLAAFEAENEALRKKKAEESVIKAVQRETAQEKKIAAATDLQAGQSRLLTRGSASQGLDKTNTILQGVQNAQQQLVANAERQLEAQKAIAANTTNTLTVRPTT